MLLYVTTDEGKERKARPLTTIPETLNLLYDQSMREHDRPAVLQEAEGGGWADTPDWRFDREVIRLALFCRERLHVRPGERVAIFGPLRPLFLSADYAAQGIGAVAVGLPHTLGDEYVVAALGEANPRVAFATDAASTQRLLSLRSRVPNLETVIGPDAPSEEPATIPLDRFLELGATLDTAERANVFRETARAIGSDQPALWHYSPEAPLRVARLTHREAMARVRGHLRRLPAQAGDKAYVAADPVSVEMRFAWNAFVGDGYTTIIIGRPGQASAEVRDTRPAKVLASPAWLEQLWGRVEATPPTGIEDMVKGLPGLGWLHRRARDRRWREALRKEVGERLRWVQPSGALAEDLRRKLSPELEIVDSTGPMPVSGAEAVAPARAEVPRLRPETT